MDLRKASIGVIRQNQHLSGAYVASPNFENYQYSWLRDGAFIAYAMDCVGEHDSSNHFYHWVNDTLMKHHVKLEQLMNKHLSGQQLERMDFLPCRYTLEGEEAKDDWPNFQLDGYGTWLWGLSEHIKMTSDEQLLLDFKDSIEDSIAYLVTFWKLPNSDCWEENEEKIHPSTLACIYGGLHSINEFLQRDEIKQVLHEIKQFLVDEAILENRFVKYIGSTSVDASLLWLTVPFQVFAPNDPYIIHTVKVMEERILHQGGVHRFPEDTYYGGGEWLILSCWLGWYYTLVGRLSDAEQQLHWVEAQADEQGWMTEQVLHHVNDPSFIPKWMDLWGPVASPLLWSHAMYLVLSERLKSFS